MWREAGLQVPAGESDNATVGGSAGAASPAGAAGSSAGGSAGGAGGSAAGGAAGGLAGGAVGSAAGGSGGGLAGGRAAEAQDAEVDNASAGGFFAWYGREPAASDQGVHAGVQLGTRRVQN